MMKKAELSVIGVIPQYPAPAKQSIYGKVRMPPVGIISVMSQVRGWRGLSVYAIDENNYGGPRDLNGYPDHSFLQRWNPAGVAMLYGGMSNSVPRMYAVAQQYRLSGALTIAGGSHVDALPEEALQSGVDVVVHGEGEESGKELLAAIREAKGERKALTERLRTIAGISFLDESGEPFSTGRRTPIQDLDALVAPDLTLIKHLKKRWSAIPISRGRGCGWTCEFCVVNRQYGKYKLRSSAETLEEIATYSDMGYKRFFITDDNFAMNPRRTIELCRAIGEYKRTFKRRLRLIVQVRTEIAEHEELIEAMRFAGVNMLAIGYESPIDVELEAMDKRVTRQQMVVRSRKLARHFYLHGMFIFGYPAVLENPAVRRSLEEGGGVSLRQRAKEYARFFRDAKLDTIQVFNAIPIPGTKLRARLEREGRLLPRGMAGWEKYDGQFLTYDPRPEGLEPFELQGLARTLMKRRYLGTPLARSLNYGNWMNWTYNVLGFPVRFSAFYVEHFFRNLRQQRRAANMDREPLLPRHNLFIEPLSKAWGEVRRSWRNLAIRTYGGGIVRRWMKEYKRSDHEKQLSRLEKQ